MPIRNERSEIIDSLIRAAMFSGLTLTVLMAPNAVQALDKPIQKYLKHLDEKDRRRELRKTLVYMQRQGLVRGHYEHGMEITDKARERLKKLNLDTLQIQTPKRWDHMWRIIFYDIPEQYKAARNTFSFRLKQLGCQQLQKSVWVHPHPCEEEVSAIATSLGINQYVTYLEVSKISNQGPLVERFKHLGIR